jgi:hypothetical protein
MQIISPAAFLCVEYLMTGRTAEKSAGRQNRVLVHAPLAEYRLAASLDRDDAELTWIARKFGRVGDAK